MDLSGKVAIVTGAGSGIGYAIAERFSGAGASVCIGYLGYEDDAKALAQKLPKLPIGFITAHQDDEARKRAMDLAAVAVVAHGRA